MMDDFDSIFEIIVDQLKTSHKRLIEGGVGFKNGWHQVKDIDFNLTTKFSFNNYTDDYNEIYDKIYDLFERTIIKSLSV